MLPRGEGLFDHAFASQPLRSSGREQQLPLVSAFVELCSNPPSWVFLELVMRILDLIWDFVGFKWGIGGSTQHRFALFFCFRIYD